MCERYECNLSPDVLGKAVTELNEPEENSARLAAIDRLKNKFKENTENLELVRSDDIFLLRFLRVKKFDEDRAYATLLNYHKQRTAWSELFDLMDQPRQLQKFLSEGAVLTSQNGRAKDGTYIIIGRPGHVFKNEKNVIIKFFATIILILERLLEEEEFQIYGLTVIHDLTNFGLSLAMQMSSIGRKFMHIVQEAMPIRVRSINFVNEPMVFDVAFAVVSKFMKEKIRNRLQLHGGSFENLHEKVDREHLPSFLDGTGPDQNAEQWTNEILKNACKNDDEV